MLWHFFFGGGGGFTTNLDSNRNIWTKIYKHKAAVSTSRTISTDVFSINVVICARRLRSRDSGGSRRSRGAAVRIHMCLLLSRRPGETQRPHLWEIHQVEMNQNFPFLMANWLNSVSRKVNVKMLFGKRGLKIKALRFIWQILFQHILTKMIQKQVNVRFCDKFNVDIKSDVCLRRLNLLIWGKKEDFRKPSFVTAC